MIGIHINKGQSIQDKYKTEIEDQQNAALEKLKNIQTAKPLDRQYLDKVIEYFEEKDFLLKTPNDLLKTKASALKLPVYPSTNKKNKIVYKKSDIKDEILFALNYRSLRNTFYPKYFQDLGIKACVYCNSQLTITAVKYKGGHIAKFDVDHYHSKDDYPFLSISLFNLYPSCASCNRVKSTNPVEFELYTDDSIKVKKSSYQFTLDPYSKARYLISKDTSCIEFKFKNKVDSNDTTLQDTFHIEELYETQKDIIEELIVKSQIYNDSYIKQLRSSFSKLALNPKLFERLLVGNYTEEKDIHKRPMSKFIQDIAKDLNLIK